MTGRRECTVDLDGPVRVIDYGGSGPPFVCVHGLGGWALDWQVLAPELTDHGRVTALDLPGFGESPAADRLSTIDGLQATLDRYLAEEVGQPASLVANSLGAVVSILQAARRPARVSRLILISPVLPASLRRLPHPLVAAQFMAYATPRLGELFLRTRRELLDARELVDGSLSFIAAHPERIPRAVFEERYALIERASRETDRAFLDAARSMLALLAVPGTYQRMIDDLDLPALVIHGAEDPLVSADAARHLAAVRPDWQVHVLGAVGHVAMLEAPRQVARIVGRWLDTDQSAKSAAGGEAPGPAGTGTVDDPGRSPSR